MLRVWLASMMVTLCVGHICIISPPQRGALNVTTPGDPSCYHRTPYCGGKPLPAKPTTTFKAGETSTITFQQNLNHWYPPNPGFLDIGLSFSTDPQEEDWNSIVTYNDFPAQDMVQSTVFDVQFVVPERPCTHCIVRARYVSHNPLELDPKNNTEMVFYNCAVRQPAAPFRSVPLFLSQLMCS